MKIKSQSDLGKRKNNVTKEKRRKKNTMRSNVIYACTVFIHIFINTHQP